MGAGKTPSNQNEPQTTIIETHAVLTECNILSFLLSLPSSLIILPTTDDIKKKNLKTVWQISLFREKQFLPFPSHTKPNQMTSKKITASPSNSPASHSAHTSTSPHPLRDPPAYSGD
jgi:hypothetical protein